MNCKHSFEKNPLLDTSADRSLVEATIGSAPFALRSVILPSIVIIAGWMMLRGHRLLNFRLMFRDRLDRSGFDHEIPTAIAVAAFTPFNPYVLP